MEVELPQEHGQCSTLDLRSLVGQMYTSLPLGWNDW